MNKFIGLLVLCVCLAGSSFAAEVMPPLPALGVSAPTIFESLPASHLAALPRLKGGSFDLRFVNVGQLVDLLYDDAMHVPHVISSDVLQDNRLVSFQYDSNAGDLHQFVRVFLDSLGFKIETREGVDFVSKKREEDDKDAARELFVYHPRFRSAVYLAKAVQPLFVGHMSGSLDHADSSSIAGETPVASPIAASAAQASSGGMAASERMVAPTSVSAADDLVFYGHSPEISELRKLLPELDTAPGEVVVRGWVYEVSDTNNQNSAFSIAAHVLGGQLGISNGSATSDATSLQFSGHLLDVAISALNADSRFKEVSDPHVRVMSGEQVSLSVGSQVPTLGSISYQGATGTPVQSVDYQDAGVIFSVSPTVLEDAIRVRLDEQISSFVPTTTGVNNSPTKNTRQMTTTVSLRDGEVVVLGGLVQDSATNGVNREGWLPSFLDGRSSSKSRTEVLLVLQVQRVSTDL